MLDQPKILLVVNEKEESRVAELVEILEQEGILYEVATGREEALRMIHGNQYKGVYLADCVVDMGSDRLPPAGVFALFEGHKHGQFDRFLASGLEVVMLARAKGLPVLVGDGDGELGTTRSTMALRSLGAQVMNALTPDAYEQYQKFTRMISPDGKQ